MISKPTPHRGSYATNAELIDGSTLWRMFDRRPLVAYSHHGTPYLRWVPIGMPVLGKYESLLKTVFFLYASRKEAECGEGAGATGFIVFRPVEGLPGYYHRIGVTNWHTAIRDGLSVVRINRRDGGCDVFEYGPEEWTFIAGGPDLAAIPLDGINSEYHDTRGILESMFYTNQQFAETHISIGDDVFMIGRFIDFDGIETNQPSLRFGNISVMDAAIRQPTGYFGRSIIIDMHSRAGYSGSPVFVFRTSGSHFGDVPEGDILRAEWFVGHTMAFIGIHWGQFPERWEISMKGDANQEAGRATLVTEGQYVRGLSGMTCVIPPDEIQKVLASLPIAKQLQRRDKIIKADFRKRGPQPIAESSG